jgi:hypothetical protein
MGFALKVEQKLRSMTNKPGFAYEVAPKCRCFDPAPVAPLHALPGRRGSSRAPAAAGAVAVADAVAAAAAARVRRTMQLCLTTAGRAEGLTGDFF